MNKGFRIICVMSALVLFGCSSFDEMRKAAERGEPAAQYQMGEYYRSDDPALAFLWMERAAKADYPEAMVELGTFFREGIGTGRNPDAALMWYEKAALEFRNAKAARLLGEWLLPDPPKGKAELAVQCYQILLADPKVSGRERFAAMLLEEGRRLKGTLLVLGRDDEAAAVSKRFTALFGESAELFDLADPKVLEKMDFLSDENYVLPALRGAPPVPADVHGAAPEFAELLAACDRLEPGELPALMESARKEGDLAGFLTRVPELVVPMFYGKPELYRGVNAGRSLYDFMLFGSGMELRRDLTMFELPFPVVVSRTMAEGGEGEFLFGKPGLAPLPPETPARYGESELFGVRIGFDRQRDFKEILTEAERVYGKLEAVEHTYRVIYDSRPYVVKITVPAWERRGKKLDVLLTDGSAPVRVELEELLPGSPERRQWEEYIAMNSRDRVFVWKNQNAEHYLTAATAFDRLKLREYEKKAFAERVKQEFNPGITLEVWDVRRRNLLLEAAKKNAPAEFSRILPGVKGGI